MCEKSVGELNGWWAKLFKLVLVLFSVGFVPALTWGVSVHVRLVRLEDSASRDRFSAQMYVDAQDMLDEKNQKLAIVWLTAKEVKELQRRYFPNN